MEQLMTKGEAADYLRISVGGVNRRLATGELVPTRIGGRVSFRQATLNRVNKSCERKGRHRARERAKEASL